VPPKKSATPWILGGCGCLTLLVIIAIVAGFIIKKAKDKANDVRNELKAEFDRLQDSSPTPSAAPGYTNTPSTRTDAAPASAGSSTYLNVKANLPASLQKNFVPFSFSYPKSFELQPQSDINFVKVEKYSAGGKGNTSENFAVGYARFDDPNGAERSLVQRVAGSAQQTIGRRVS
jgi:hypothetical protein